MSKSRSALIIFTNIFKRHLIYVIFVLWLINPILSLSDSRLLNPELRQNWQCKVLLIYFFVIYLNMLVKIYGGMVFVTEFTDPSVKQTEYMVTGEAGIMQGWKNWPQSWRLWTPYVQRVC